MRPTQRFAETIITTRTIMRVVICVLLAIGAAALCAIAQDNSAGVPALLDGKPVLTIRWGFGNNTATARAAAAGQRMQSVAQDTGTPLTLTQQKGELAIDIRCGNVILASVYPADAQEENSTPDALAQQWSGSMAAAMQAYREKYGWRLALYHSGFSLLGIAACLAAFLWIRNRSRRIAAESAAALARRSESSHVHVSSRLSFTLWQTVLQRLLALARLLLLIVVAVLAINALLILFPGTRPLVFGVYAGIARFASSLFGSFWANLPALLFILILAVVVWQFIRLIRYFFDKVEERAIRIEGFRPAWSTVTGRLVSIAVVLLAVLIAYPYVPGSQSPAFKGVSLFLGVLLSLGSTGLVANIISGVMLTYMGAFEAGDLVKIGEIEAYVKSTSLLTTRLVTRQNELITVPNSSILDKHVVNYANDRSGDESILITTAVGMGYDVAWRQVEAMLLEAAQRTESVLSEPAPFVVLPLFDVYTANYELNAYLKPGVRRYIGITELNHNVMDVFNEHGVSIMTPMYRADPPIPKVVAREHWFDAPASPQQSPKPADRKYPPAGL